MANFAEAEQRFNMQYEILGIAPLGEGTYGKVYKARSRRTGQPVAMKEMKLNAQDREEGVPSTAIREVAVLKELTHPNVVKLQDVFCRPGKLVLVFEFLENDLKKYMKQQDGHVSPAVVKQFSYQLFKGVEFCHSHRIFHRDIKPQNLLIDGSLNLKIADFGMARAFMLPAPKYTHEVVTLWYRPPEILLGREMYSLPVDVWSCACVVAEIATGTPLFPGDSEIDTIFKIFQKLGTPTEQTFPGLLELPDYKPTFPRWPKREWSTIRNIAQQVGTDGISLLEQAMMYDPQQRLSARGAVQHAYFRNVGGA